MLLFAAYVTGLVTIVVSGIRYPRRRWTLLVIGLFYLAVPVLALLALRALFSHATFG